MARLHPTLWNDGVLEYWSGEQEKRQEIIFLFLCFTLFTHYSITPSLQYSNIKETLFNAMTRAKEKTIPIEKLTPNMTLAREITKPNGDLIFGQSGNLTESIIERLKRFGVREVTVAVKEADESLDPKYIKKKMKEMEEGLDYRFRKVSHIPLMIELKELLSEHLKGKLVS